MAVEKTILRKSLTVNASAGMDANGSIINKAYNFSGINQAAADQNLYDVGVALGGLMNGDVNSINVTEKDELAEA